MKRLLRTIRAFWHRYLVAQGMTRKSKRPQPTPLFLPSAIPIEELQQGCSQGLGRMALQAERVNQLSRQLEIAMTEMKVLATEVNRDWRAIQFLTTPNKIPENICHYQVREIPYIQRHRQGTFTITSRPLDLFQAEREAASIAQTLRHRHRRKLKVAKG